MRLDVRRLDTINWVRGDRTNSSDMQWQVASGFTDWTRATWDGVLRILCYRNPCSRYEGVNDSLIRIFTQRASPIECVHTHFAALNSHFYPAAAS